MSLHLIHGDQVSCSRVGGAMRRQSARLRQHAQSLEDALGDLWTQSDSNLVATTTDPSNTTDPSAIAVPSAVADPRLGLRDASGPSALRALDALEAMRAVARDLDEAGAVLQRYATDLAEGHQLGRRAELRVQGAGLLLDGNRVIEPWGLASAQDAARRRSKVPEVQARVDLATAHVGRARGRLEREVTRLTESLTADSLDARSALQTRRVRRAPLPPR